MRFAGPRSVDNRAKPRSVTLTPLPRPGRLAPSLLIYRKGESLVSTTHRFFYFSAVPWSNLRATAARRDGRMADLRGGQGVYALLAAGSDRREECEGSSVSVVAPGDRSADQR